MDFILNFLANLFSKLFKDSKLAAFGALIASILVLFLGVGSVSDENTRSVFFRIASIVVLVLFAGLISMKTKTNNEYFSEHPISVQLHSMSWFNYAKNLLKLLNQFILLLAVHALLFLSLLIVITISINAGGI